MSTLKLHSECFPPTGGVDAEGIRNQLGRPEFDPWALVVREAIQNACDARAPGQATVQVAFEWRALSPAQHEHLHTQMLGEPAPALPDKWRKQPEATRVLVIADRGTVGLTGPTRADTVSNDTNERRFVGLLRNVGQPPDRPMSGGSFGFGKAAFYILSRCQTAIIHTRWRRPDGQLESRFMVAAVGQRATVNGKRLTGRHWWGRPGNDEVVEPLLDDDANEFAALLGLPPFVGTDTGTTIAVLDPDPYTWPRSEVGQVLRDAILWNFWPVMLAPEPGQPAPAQFSLALDGAQAAVIDPHTEPLLQPFISAFQLAAANPDSARGAATDRGNGRRLHSIRTRGVLIAVLGLAVAPIWKRTARAAIVRLPRVGGPDLENGMHHVALMRRPRFVVRYEVGPALLDEGLGYGGACLVADHADDAFKRAENQTHNQWVHQHLTNPDEQNWVQQLLKAVRSHTKALVEPAPELASVSLAGAALGPLATALGSLLYATTRTHEPPTSRTRGGQMMVKVETPPSDTSSLGNFGDPNTPGGADTAGNADPAGSGASNAARTERPMGRPTVRPREATLDVWEGKGVLRIPVTVTRGIRAAGFELNVVTQVMLDQGVEKDAPMGAPVPRVLAWLDDAGNMEAGAMDTRRWPESDKWSGTILIELVDDAAIQPVLSGESIAPPLPDAPAERSAQVAAEVPA